MLHPRRPLTCGAAAGARCWPLHPHRHPGPTMTLDVRSGSRGRASHAQRTRLRTYLPRRCCPPPEPALRAPCAAPPHRRTWWCRRRSPWAHK
eukprot:259375-Chlamydomonas_euryale.AAC.1